MCGSVLSYSRAVRCLFLLVIIAPQTLNTNTDARIVSNVKIFRIGQWEWKMPLWIHLIYLQARFPCAHVFKCVLGQFSFPRLLFFYRFMTNITKGTLDQFQLAWLFFHEGWPMRRHLNFVFYGKCSLLGTRRWILITVVANSFWIFTLFAISLFFILDVSFLEIKIIYIHAKH